MGTLPAELMLHTLPCLAKLAVGLIFNVGLSSLNFCFHLPEGV